MSTARGSATSPGCLIIGILLLVPAMFVVVWLTTLGSLVYYGDRVPTAPPTDTTAYVGFARNAFYVGVTRVADGQVQWLRSEDGGLTWIEGDDPGGIEALSGKDESWTACAEDESCYRVSNKKRQPGLGSSDAFSRLIERMPAGGKWASELALDDQAAFEGLAVDSQHSDRAIILESQGKVLVRMRPGDWRTVNVRAVADQLQAATAVATSSPTPTRPLPTNSPTRTRPRPTNS